MLQYSLSIAVARVQIIRIFTMRTRFVENYIHLSTILQSNEKKTLLKCFALRCNIYTGCV